MNNPFDYTPDDACEEAFRRLIARIEELKGSDSPDDMEFIRELEAGKMLGVLIATDADGMRRTLYAFSGQLGSAGFSYPGFVDGVFDYLSPDGHFKMTEEDISRQSAAISEYEESVYAKAIDDYNRVRAESDAEIADFKEKCRRSKMERDAVRESGVADDDELSAMIRRSQYEKAELRRLKKRLEARLRPFADDMEAAKCHLEALKEKRRSDSEALQSWLFSNFRLLNAMGESRSLSEIFAGTSLRIPPSGAGECCAPKLLQAAYLQGWHPESIAEYWYGKPRGGEMRIHGAHYPACRGKCLPVLDWMLRGLPIDPPLDSSSDAAFVRDPEILYANEWFCIVDKPSGMLSVPGKGRAISLQQWLSERYGHERDVRMAHRLDRDTSGLMIATFGELSYKVMQSLFATREVKKTYVAELDGDYKSHGIAPQGHISLPVSPDWFDRPRQRIDIEGGKPAETDYEFITVAKGRSRVVFHPLTGRTHQLRVHSASVMGLGMPIAGDRLYGMNPGVSTERLHLHAHRLEFRFPIDGRHYCFESPVPF